MFGEGWMLVRLSAVIAISENEWLIGDDKALDPRKVRTAILSTRQVAKNQVRRRLTYLGIQSTSSSSLLSSATANPHLPRTMQYNRFLKSLFTTMYEHSTALSHL